MNETDRTIVALLWHENVVDLLEKETEKSKVFCFYLKVLKNICFADYIDRITFQNQIWNFNEMSSLIKTFYNNKLFHSVFGNQMNLDDFSVACEGEGKLPSQATAISISYPLCTNEKTDNFSVACEDKNKYIQQNEFFETKCRNIESKCIKNIIKSPSEIRFTKVLTKYSTEYNNILFFYKLSQELEMDKRDVVAFFQEMRIFYGENFLQNPEVLGKIEKELEDYNISKLDIRRIYRYLDKNVKKENIVLNNEEDIEDDWDSGFEEE
jgi:hypothetical protein